MITKLFRIGLFSSLLALSTLPVHAEDYAVDTEGMHAFIQFKIQHLGYSWLYGRFNDFTGSFVFDEDKPSDSTVNIVIDTTSVDTNHAERDKHLRGDDFLNTGEHPQARFVSTKADLDAQGNGTITGNFTLNGITRPLTLTVERIGGGKDPWGGYRQGFEATTSFKLKDFGIDYDLGPASQVVDIQLSIEGIRQS